MKTTQEQCEKIVGLARVSQHEARLAEAAPDSRFISGQPEKIISDKAYDSDQLDEKFLKKMVQVFCFDLFRDKFRYINRYFLKIVDTAETN